MSWLPAHDLLSLSAEFEGSLRRGRGEMPALAALRILGGLEEVARASLLHRAPSATIPAPSGETRSQPGRIQLPPPPSEPSLWSTRSRAYRPALGDPSVIEALLGFRDRAPPIDAPAPAPAYVPAQPPRARPQVPAKRLAPQQEISPSRPERLSAKDLEPCFPFAPSSNLLRPRQ